MFLGLTALCSPGWERLCRGDRGLQDDKHGFGDGPLWKPPLPQWPLKQLKLAKGPQRGPQMQILMLSGFLRSNASRWDASH